MKKEYRPINKSKTKYNKDEGLTKSEGSKKNRAIIKPKSQTKKRT